MSLFRQLGRQVELLTRLAKQTARDPSIDRCTACEAAIPAGGDYCLYCGHQPPHDVLGVDPDASDAAVKAAAREQLKSVHPDHGGSQAAFERVKRARDQVLED